MHKIQKELVVFLKVMEAREDAKKSALYQKQPNFPPCRETSEAWIWESRVPGSLEDPSPGYKPA